MAFSRYDFIAFYDEYHTPLYRYILVRCSDVATAQDVTSETFYRVFRYCSKNPNKKPDNMRAYIYTVGSRVLAEHFKKKLPTSSLSDEDIQQVVGSITYETSYRTRGILGEFGYVYKALRALPPEYSEIIILRYIEDLPYADITLIMGRSEGALRTLHTRALKKLRLLLGSK